MLLLSLLEYPVADLTSYSKDKGAILATKVLIKDCGVTNTPGAHPEDMMSFSRMQSQCAKLCWQIDTCRSWDMDNRTGHRCQGLTLPGLSHAIAL